MSMEICGVLHFSANNLINGASYVLDLCRALAGNCIQRIKWYHPQARTANVNV